MSLTSASMLGKVNSCLLECRIVINLFYHDITVNKNLNSQLILAEMIIKTIEVN